MTHNVRVTQEPGVVREVDDRELVDLQRLGLLESFEHTPEALALLPEGFKTPSNWKAAKDGEEVVTAPPAITDTDVAPGVTTKGK